LRALRGSSLKRRQKTNPDLVHKRQISSPFEESGVFGVSLGAGWDLTKLLEESKTRQHFQEPSF
jgi:hypothetical protein